MWYSAEKGLHPLRQSLHFCLLLPPSSPSSRFPSRGPPISCLLSRRLTPLVLAADDASHPSNSAFCSREFGFPSTSWSDGWPAHARRCRCRVRSARPGGWRSCDGAPIDPVSSSSALLRPAYHIFYSSGNDTFRSRIAGSSVSS